MKSSETSNFFKNVKKVGFFGLGKSNLALINKIPDGIPVVLRSEGKIDLGQLPKDINIADIRESAAAFSSFTEDIIFLSPSVRRERAEFDAARTLGIRFSSDLEFFLSENKADIIAVSGSDGKSTTATLAWKMLKNANNALLIGNIGTPFCETSTEIRQLAVCEISSFQLRYARVFAKRAALTNITPNHLNWHENFEEYKKTKLSLLESTDEAVISADDRLLYEYGRKRRLFAVTSVKSPYKELKELFSAEYYFTREAGYIMRNGKAVISLSEILRSEEHNIKNLLSAIALTEGYRSDEEIRAAARSFTGLAHRCERLPSSGDTVYINSSIDTSPARTAATLSSLGNGIIIILGGKDKGIGYTRLCSALTAHVKLAVITGENRDKIYNDIKDSTKCALIPDFKDAVIYAASAASQNDTVLLSPASASYDSFNSFEERGEFFKGIISDFCKNSQNL